MASYNKNKVQENESTSDCLHPRLVLNATPNGYLTGEYICEQCGYLLKLPSHKVKPKDADGPRRQST
jgi:hypothetical protein